MKTVYTAKLTPKESEKGYYAKIVELDGCVTTGKSLYDAIEQIKDALSVFLVALEDSGDIIPNGVNLYDYTTKNDGIYTLVEVDTKEYRKSLRE